MEKYKLTKEFIKELFGTEKSFASMDDFVTAVNEALDKKDLKGATIKDALKTLLQSLISDEEEKKKILDKIESNFVADNIQWMKDNCVLEVTGGESAGSQTQQYDREPETDFDKVKRQFKEKDSQNIHPLPEDELDYSAGIVFFNGGIVTQQDRMEFVSSKPERKFDLSKILVVEESGTEVLAMGHLVLNGENTYTAVFDNKNHINYEKLGTKRRVRFVFYTENGDVFGRLVEIDFRDFPKENNKPLCIDFGTSNTSAGSYCIFKKKDGESDTDIVYFIDVTKRPRNTEVALLPTVVYVADCSDENNIKYLFGYEAKKRIEEERYESKASVFYEIKRWVSSADEDVEIRDNDNNKATPKKKDIVKAYLDYVIECAEQYLKTRFQKIHFSAPVKLKEQFIDVFQDLYYGEREVLGADESIDEGVAIVYNQIIKLRYERMQNDCEKKIMIMDCGGGTTDMASCTYKYEKCKNEKTKSKGDRLTLETCFENGNSNFGGNNITYRIMQLLKIKVAAALKNNYIDAGGNVFGLIDKSENEILGLVEENIKHNPYDSDKANDDIYGQFLNNYARAEDLIPTIYVDNDRYKGAESLKKIKRNFHYLWLQAEQIKIDFFKTERVQMDFKEEAKIEIKKLCDYLYTVNDTNPNFLDKKEEPFKGVTITIKEINRLICGDIYSLLVGLFHNDRDEDGNGRGGMTSQKIRVDEFDYYKLSGQSCKISLFTELIKEYIPGRKLRPAIEKKNGKIETRTSEDFKLDCVKGCISYVQDRNRPGMVIDFNHKTPEIIYNVCLKWGHESNDKMLFDCTNPSDIKFEVSSESAKEYPLMIKGRDNSCEQEFIFKLETCGESKDDDIYSDKEIYKVIREDTSPQTLPDDKINRFVKALAEQANALSEGECENLVFVVPAALGYGVYIGQIHIKKTADSHEYRFLKWQYRNFEDSSKTFFDGRR